jgi:hypothetical protein
MVKIIPRGKESFGEVIGRNLGQGLSQGVTNAADFQFEMMKNAPENRALKDQYGIDLTGIQNPEIRREILSNRLARSTKLDLAKKESSVDPLTGDILENPSNQDYSTGRLQEPERSSSTRTSKVPKNVTAEKEAAETRNVEALPSRTGMGKAPFVPQNGRGNMPQAASSGVVQPVMSPNEEIQLAQKRTQSKQSQGVDTTFEQEYADVVAMNNQAKLSNQQVNEETETRKAAQRDYDILGVKHLLTMYPEATAEMQSIFAKKAEQLAASNMSEADINLELSKEVKRFKSAIEKVKDIPQNPKLLNTKINSAFAGDSRSFEEAKASIRTKLKPLLELGLYDTARKLLSEKKGYYPEDRESILSDPSENTTKTLAEFSPIKQIPQRDYFNMGKSLLDFPGTQESEERYKPQEIESFRNNFESVIQRDPKVNLINLRKSYEDKGVDWRLFKNTLDEMVAEGKIELDDDQYNALTTLENPPLSRLGEILYNLKLIGR